MGSTAVRERRLVPCLVSPTDFPLPRPSLEFATANSSYGAAVQLCAAVISQLLLSSRPTALQQCQQQRSRRRMDACS